MRSPKKLIPDYDKSLMYLRGCNLFQFADRVTKLVGDCLDQIREFYSVLQTIQDGKDGSTPYINNGYWWINNNSTGVLAEGKKGDKGNDGEVGPAGPKGDNGDKGDPGQDGIGVPSGGLTGQVLKKKSDSNYDTEWGEAGNVKSVNGKTGIVVLSANDVNALPNDTPLFSGSYNDLTDKPTIPTALSQLSEDTTHRTVSDTEKTTWGNKQEPLVSGTNIKTINNESVLGSGDISAEKPVVIEAPVNATDATLPITTLTCEAGKYYRIDVAVDTLGVTLPAMTDLTTVRTVVIYLTAGTTPAVTISSTAPSGGSAPDVYYQDGFEIEAGSTYEINALFNGAAWIVAAVKINTSNS